MPGRERASVRPVAQVHAEVTATTSGAELEIRPLPAITYRRVTSRCVKETGARQDARQQRHARNGHEPDTEVCDDALSRRASALVVLSATDALGCNAHGAALAATSAPAAADGVTVLVEPQTGVAPFLRLIDGAQKSIELTV